MSTAQGLEVGVCIIRVEAQPDRLLITVTLNRHVDRNLYSARPSPELHFADPKLAIEAVERFLGDFRP